MWGREMGKKEKQNGLSIVKKGGTGDKRVESNIPIWVVCTVTWGHGEVPTHAAGEGREAADVCAIVRGFYSTKGM